MRGLIHIYTGDGKGKTTSAIGLATRALGGGLSVLYVSFHKRPEMFGYTEMDSLRKLGATVVNFSKGHPHLDKSITVEQMVAEVAQGLAEVNSMLAVQHYDMLIMDEIMISVRDKYIDQAKVIEFMLNKPSSMELVMTGRGATPELVEIADYVSFVQKIKHPFDSNISSRKGIEY